jgi:hypothetical protein
MNVINGASLLMTIIVWVVAAIGIAVAATYFFGPKVRARYPGGKGRYLLALFIQASGFMIPIPVVLILMIGRLPFGLDVILAVAVGFFVVLAMRFLPLTGPLLRDLTRTRLELALERMGGKPQ